MRNLAVICALLAAACGPSKRTAGGGDDDGTGVDGGGSGTPTPRECNKMDIVFVVDDSGSMMEEQQNLATNFPVFANVLSQYRTTDNLPLDYRVAVTTTGKDITTTLNVSGLPPITMTEHGEDGAFHNTCGVSARYLDDSDPNLATDLSCRANVGTDGPSVEMPMLMTKHALADRIADGTNTGFLRDDALLAVVMITDEDDWSNTMSSLTMDMNGSTPVNFNPPDLVDFLDTLKGNRTRWSAAVIAGDGDCSSGFGSATDAKRLKAFVTAANDSGTTQATFSSICDGDLSIGLTKAINQFQSACGGVIF